MNQNITNFDLSTTAMALEEKWNVIVMDWSSLSHTFITNARSQVLLAGELLGNFTAFLRTTFQIDLKTLHYIGHGLGVNVSAKAAEVVSREHDTKVGRLTALDPVKGLFEIRQFLDLKDSSDFVDVVHTDGDGMGTMSPMGHVDYYPNGGKGQPHCSSCEYLNQN